MSKLLIEDVVQPKLAKQFKNQFLSTLTLRQPSEQTPLMQEVNTNPNFVNRLPTPDDDTDLPLASHLKNEFKEKWSKSTIARSTRMQFDENEKLTPYSVAYALAEKFNFLADGTHLSLFLPDRGFFVPLKTGCGEGTLDAFVRGALPAKNRSDVNTSFIAEIEKWLLSTALDLPVAPDFAKRNLVAFKNGTFDFFDGNLHEHSPKNFLTCGIKAEYVRKANKKIRNTRFWSFLTRLADEDDRIIQALRLVIGLALSNVRRIKLIPYIVGVSNNGKSVLAGLIEGLIPQYSCTALEISELADKFARGSLYGAHVNISSDENTSKWNPAAVAFLKRAVVGDSTKGEEKFKPLFTFRCRAFFICIANAMPRFDQEADDGGAISQRLYVIPTTELPVSIEEEDPVLLEKLLEERDLIASWAIEGIKDLVLTGRRPEKLVTVMPCSTATDFNSAFELWAEECVHVTATDSKTEATQFLASFKIFAQNYRVIFSDKAFYMKLAVTYKAYKREGRRSYYIGLDCNSPNTDAIF